MSSAVDLEPIGFEIRTRAKTAKRRRHLFGCPRRSDVFEGACTCGPDWSRWRPRRSCTSRKEAETVLRQMLRENPITPVFEVAIFPVYG